MTSLFLTEKSMTILNHVPLRVVRGRRLCFAGFASGTPLARLPSRRSTTTPPCWLVFPAARAFVFSSIAQTGSRIGDRFDESVSRHGRRARHGRLHRLSESMRKLPDSTIFSPGMSPSTISTLSPKLRPVSTLRGSKTPYPGST